MGPVTIAITNVMVLFNSAVNPFVYALLNKQFREKIKRMIRQTRFMLRTSEASDIHPVNSATPPSRREQGIVNAWTENTNQTYTAESFSKQ